MISKLTLTPYRVEVVGWAMITILALSPIFVYSPLLHPRVTGPVLAARWAAGALAIWFVATRQPIKFTPLTLAVIAWAGALIITSIVGVDPHMSFFSVPERMTGAVDQLAWAALALMLPRAMNGRWVGLLEIAFIVVLAQVLAAFVDRGAFYLGIDWGNARVVGLTANPGKLAVYLLAAIPLTAWMGSRKAEDWPYYAITVAATVALWLTDTRAGYLGMAMAAGVLWVIYRGPHRNRLRLTILASCALLATLVMIGGTRPITATGIPGGSTESAEPTDRARLAEIAITAFKEKPIAGYGPNGYQAAFNNQEPGATITADSAHNMVLDEIATKGILSVFSFIVWALAAWRLFRAGDDHARLMLALLMGLGAYGIFWFMGYPWAWAMIFIVGYAIDVENGQPKGPPNRAALS